MAASLAITLVVEGALGIAIFKSRSTAAYILFLNLLTNPILNIALIAVAALMPAGYFAALVIFECAVIFTEGLLLRKYLKKSLNFSLALSALLNLCSYTLGCLIFG